MAKNKFNLVIENCLDCPNHCGKMIDGQIWMVCQTNRSCIRLRKDIGRHSVPDWCPHLMNNIARTVQKKMQAKTSSINQEVVERLQDRYSREAVLKRRAEELQARIPTGHIMTVEHFIELVDEGSIIDDDGCGTFADFCANKKEPVWCDVDWIERHRNNYPFVIWYNR